MAELTQIYSPFIGSSGLLARRFWVKLVFVIHYQSFVSEVRSFLGIGILKSLNYVSTTVNAHLT